MRDSLAERDVRVDEEEISMREDFDESCGGKWEEASQPGDPAIRKEGHEPASFGQVDALQ